MDAEGRKLVNLEIKTKDRVWNRCLLLDTPLSQEDIEFYYKQLLGFEDAEVAISTEEVPPDFNRSLLSINDSAPSEFPANDLETAPADADRREKYSTFIHQLCEMERSRVALRFSLRSNEQKAQATSAVSEEPTYLNGVGVPAALRTQWVQEILKELNAEHEFEGAIVASARGEKQTPYAWIFTPTVAHARKNVGSRVILDAAVGEKWENLLGSYIYPDMIVSRRISASGWVFKHELSDRLVENIVQWYLASQDATVKDGISTLIIGVENTLSQLFTMFRKVKVNERFLTEGSDESDVSTKMYKLLAAVEAQQLASADIDPLVQAISYDSFQKFVQYIFKASGIPREIYLDDVGVDHVLNRWVRSHFGFKAGADPILASWKDMWDLVMRGKPTVIKFNLFLASMDSWDPISNTLFSIAEKASVAQEWVRIYMDTQVSSEPKGRIKSVVLYDQIRQWVVKYIPEHMYSTQLTPMVIGPILSKKGFDSRKTKDGRYTYGIKFKNPVIENESSVSEAYTPQTDVAPLVEQNVVQFTEIRRETEDGKLTQQRTVQAHTVVAEEDGTRIEHFFKASIATQEIHLGNL